MHAIRMLYTLAVTGLVVGSVAAAESSATVRIRERFAPFVQQQIERQQIPGLAVGVVLNGELVYSQGFGVQRLGEAAPVTSRTLFHQASITKPFVATAIMQLAERGRLKLDDLVTEHLPYFKVRGEQSEGITIKQLMNHTSGMPDVLGYDWANPKYGDGELENHVRFARTRKLKSLPGEKFAYSNLGYEILGDVIAKASDKTFEAFVTESILEPLDMQRSTLMVRDADPQLVAAPHVKDAEGNIVASDVYPYNRRHAPSSTLVANVEDMARWAIANLNRGSLDGKRILDERAYEQLWQKTAEISGPRSMGLGWFLYEVEGHSLVAHGGSDRGFASLLVLAPADGAAVILMANKHRASLQGIATKAIRVTLDDS